MNDDHFLLILLIAHWYSRKFKMHWVNLGLKICELFQIFSLER